MRGMGGVGLAFLLSLAFVPAADSERVALELEVAGEERTALVFAPGDEDAANLPLIIVFHGLGDDSGRFARAVRMHKDWPDAVVVYPRGMRIDSRPAMRGWQPRAGTYNDRDLALTDALLDELQALYPIDPGRKYAAGFSNGGNFTMLLMSERASEFAAFAVIGALQPEFVSDAPPRPLLFLFGRGENPDLKESWVQTVVALSRHQRVNGEQIAYESCCTLLPAAPDGAPMVYGLYNAGHIWPHHGNDWLRNFMTRFNDAGPDNERSGH